MRAAQREQRAVHGEEPLVRLLRQLRPVELRAGEGLRVLRVGHDVGVPAVLGELADPALGGGLAQLRLGVAGEELPRRASRPTPRP